jgi:hypothetical protein
MRNVLYTLFLLSFLSLLGFSSCKKKKTTAVKFHLDYFPIQKDRFVVYNVLQVEHDFLVHPIPDSFRYQLKVKIGDTISDNLGRTANEYRRYLRPNAGQAWQYTDLWTVILDDYKLELVEENNRKLKLVFSPNIKKTWNANQFNNLGEQIVKYSAVHTPFLGKFLQFDSTLTVNQEKTTNFIQHKFKFEIYAKNIGLVKLFFKDLDINNNDTLNVRKGSELFYDAVSFGFE